MNNILEFKQKELSDIPNDVCKKHDVKRAILIVEFYRKDAGGAEFYKSKACDQPGALKLLGTAIGLLMKEWGVIG